MNGWLAVVLVVLVAANPALLAGSSPFERRRLYGVAAGLGMIAVVAVFTDPILEALSVSVPTFRTAAGAVVAVGGARQVLRRRRGAGCTVEQNPVFSGMLPTVMPPPVFAAVAATAGDGWWLTAGALAATLAATVGFAVSKSAGIRWWGRIAFGGLAVAGGILLVTSGLRSV